MQTGKFRIEAVVFCLTAIFLNPRESTAQNGDLIKALAMKPIQKNARFEEVEPDKVKDCSLEKIKRTEGEGFVVTGPDGQTLRWFVDTNGDGKFLDRWSYFASGVEVYREIDSDFDGTPDEFRWLGTEGMRWGVDSNNDKKIDRWKMISAEEVTAEVVDAAAQRNGEQFSSLLITASEIESLGLSEEKAKELREKSQRARSEFGKWASVQKLVNRDTHWTHFGAEKPGIVPAGTGGSEKDVVVYENVVALMENKGQSQQLLVGTMIQVGSNWRLVDLPRVVGEGSELSETGVFFNVSISERNPNIDAPVNNGGISKAMERLAKDLQDVDTRLQASGSSTASKEILQGQRADLIEKLISESTVAEDRSNWIKQFADTVSAATQSGEFPSGVKRLHEMTSKLQGSNSSKDDIAYVTFRAIAADYMQKTQTQDGNIQDEQKKYLENLEQFVKDFPTSPDAAEGMIQIALSAELALDVKTANLWYGRASRDFAKTLPGQKAAGALTRLSIERRQFSLQGTTLDGRAFDSAVFAKDPIIFHYWASWCEPCKAEMRALKELQSKYSKQRLRIVGINLDNEPEAAKALLKASGYSWLQLHEKGGLDGKLAVDLGVLTLPVNLVVDGTGKVVRSGVHWTELEGILEKMAK